MGLIIFLAAFSKEFWITIAASIPAIAWTLLIAQRTGQPITVPALQSILLMGGLAFIWHASRRKNLTLKLCTQCGRRNPADNAYCGACGYPFDQTRVYD